MAYRIFEGKNGSKWEVWLVIPTAAERRRGERRVAHGSAAVAYSGPERRVGRDRRTRAHGARTIVSPEFEGGWLCFESDQGEKRRLAPVPLGWEAATDDELWGWCEAAVVVARCSPLREER